jgi:general secretion pathway protein G
VWRGITGKNEKVENPAKRWEPTLKNRQVQRKIASMNASRRARQYSQAGMTLLELIIVSAIMLILATAALPVVRFTIVRQREAELHRDLREIRNAIDHYKDYADRNLIRVEIGTEGYPPDMDTLVKGIKLGDAEGRKIRFLRRLPVDPMTGKAEWNLQSIQDDPDSTSWGGKNVFDVHSTSQGTALDGTRYAEW